MKTSNKIHYVYRITNLKPTDERLYYIGVRSTTKASAELDTNYHSSSKYLKEAMGEIGHKNFKKEILSEFKTRKLAIKEEIRLHDKFDVAKNTLFYNKSKQTNTGFDTSGYVTVLDTRDNKTKSVTKKEYDKFDYYISESMNKVSIKDKKSGKVIRLSKDEFKNRKDLEFHTKNKVTAYDDNGNKFHVSKSEYKRNKKLKHTATGTVVARNKITGEKTRIPKEMFDTDDNWVSLNLELGISNIINIYDADNNLVKIYNGNFDPQCRKDNLPYAELHKSYKSGGKFKIYPKVLDGSAPKCMISRLTNSGKIQYVGWYAKISK